MICSSPTPVISGLDVRPTHLHPHLERRPSRLPHLSLYTPVSSFTPPSIVKVPESASVNGEVV